jgi:hypothetical protein
MARDLTPEEKHDKRRLDYESMALSFACRPGDIVRAWKAYESESARHASRPTTDGGRATVYVVELLIRSMVGPGRYHSSWTVRIDMGGSAYPRAVPWPSVLSSPKPWGPHFSLSGGGLICNGNVWSANLTLAEYVVGILRLFNYDENIHRTDGGLNSEAKTYWKVKMGGKPIDPALVYPVPLLPPPTLTPTPPLFGRVVVSPGPKQ